MPEHCVHIPWNSMCSRLISDYYHCFAEYLIVQNPFSILNVLTDLCDKRDTHFFWLLHSQSHLFCLSLLVGVFRKNSLIIFLKTNDGINKWESVYLRFAKWVRGFLYSLKILQVFQSNICVDLQTWPKFSVTSSFICHQ